MAGKSGSQKTLSKEEIKKYFEDGDERPIKIIRRKLVWRKGKK